MAKIRKSVIVDKINKAVNKATESKSSKEKIDDEKKEMKLLKGLMKKGGKRGNC